MGEKVNIPAVGESIVEVIIASWLKKDGDHVSMDEPIAELESDKATFELVAPQSGTLKIIKSEGDTVPVGEAVCEIIPSASKESSSQKADPVLKSSIPKSTGVVKEMRVPAVGESITEVTLATWIKKEGIQVDLDEVIAEIESDKATFELRAEARGLLRVVAQEGDVLSIGDLICKIEVMEGGDVPTSSPVTDSSSIVTSASNHYAEGHPSPAAQKILEEKGISTSAVKGTGVGGRIRKEDAMHATANTTPLSSSEHVQEGLRTSRREKMSSLRKTIARRLVAAKNSTAMLTTFNEVNMEAIMNMRSLYKEDFKKKYDVGLGFMSFFTKATCAALKEFPAINAYLDGDEVEYHDYCDISIAVSTPRGLVVPVVRNAETLTMDEIEKEVIRLATKGRDGKLSIEEMTGGTFSITNGGVFGSMLSTPILNPPQSAILGMHNIVQRPVVIQGDVVVRPIMYLALSYDHRIVDGKESVSFLVRIKEMLEDPRRLMLTV